RPSRPTPFPYTTLFRSHHASLDWFARDDAFAWTVVLIHQGHATYCGLELLHAGVTGRVVLHVRHHKLPATFFGRDIFQDGFHFGDRKSTRLNSSHELIS